ncbi:probable protein S-acyltransferase 13 [Primulina huaijiensis]|uniref:probable protein S-acyltransferase 13 n=1 Tax=Primulina huaijiensis TaxID=1492673 RepID=UPI003CC6F315
MTLLSVVLVTLFHALLVLLSWSYFMVLLKDPGSVPANWKMSPQQNVEDGSSVISSISVVFPNMTSSQGSERKPTGYCDRCQNGKPPRCHHCSVCKMANDAFLRWIIIAYGLSTVSGLKTTIFFSFCGLLFSGDIAEYSCAASQFHKVLSRSKASFELTWETGCHFLGLCSESCFCAQSSLFRNYACVVDYQQHNVS